MADQFQFGDHNTADIQLQLIYTDGTEYQRKLLHLHSIVLRKSEFYNTLLSERWSLEKTKPFEITVPSRYSGEIYIKCIQLMYSSHAGKPLRFSNVDEALAILPVASELLFQQCMEECMKYLSAVPWSTKQEVKLRALLLSLEISIWGDLSDRLGMIQCKQDLGGQQMLEQTLQKMLSTISSGSFVNGEYIEEYIIAHFNANESIAETCRSALLKEFSANIERAKFETPKSCSALSWIVKVIDRRDEELFETVFYMFCKDAEIPKVVYRYIAWDRYCRDNSGYSNRLVDIMDRFLKALRNGRIITCIPFRVSFLTNWISVLVNLKGNEKLMGNIVDVSETLPLVYQRRIYNVGKEAMNTYLSEDRFTRMVIEEWGKKLQEAIERHNFFDMTGKIY